MKHKFPIITHINDVLPHLEGFDEFVVMEKDGYQVILYRMQISSSFGDTESLEVSKGDLIRRECRGMTFDMDGNLIGRKFNKFFNVGERLETMISNVDLSEPHIILEKLDGCCEASTLITAPDGDKTIKELCDNNYKGLIMGFNHISKSAEWVQCFKSSIEKNRKKWFEIETVNGNKIKLTGNHKVWCVNRSEYVRVDELTSSDDLEIL